ncbi:hypothetical protein VCHA35O141_60168 [Vibrio chagasii]|nr:hypothetical protein VCHA38P215_110017 [Vibrio chagasii]CAH6932559.1 hypothetical protein VCHA48P434_110170 [Vibrio chagasii]CAH7038411.1 hypothetical protein VCHA31O73_60035 [Vibrio chagasii]CAH7061611.1 hypothetical protein VCHA35O141_60168 [Vibrio chagasii]CAH7089246.1 hypothetical protein VCHA35O143_70170 [Vibrio chagasii]
MPNNTAVVATLMESVLKNPFHAPKKLFIPLSYFSIIGGTLTLIGTATNLVVSGVFCNALANQFPNKAHAVFTLNENQQNFTVSVRAPLNNRTGADEICCQFATGGGRKAAAGINALPIDKIAEFIQVLNNFYK